MPIGSFEVGEAELIRPKFDLSSHEKVNIIQERLKNTQSCQKSYTDVRRRDLEFEVNDWLDLKVSPLKSIMRFGKESLILVTLVPIRS